MKKGFLLLFLCFGLLHTQAQVALNGIYTPFQLNRDTSRIIISDYVVDGQITHLLLPPGLKNISKQADELLLVGDLSEKMATLSFQNKGKQENLVLIKPSTQEVEIKIPKKEIGKKKQLRLIGAFNNWNRGSSILNEERKFYTASYLLEPGRYEYKLYLDGKELLDPTNPITVSNGMGSFNNVLLVKGDSLKPGNYELSSQSNGISIRRMRSEANFIVLWNNKVLPSPCKGNYPSYCISQIPAEAKKIKRSYLRVFSYLGENIGLWNTAKCLLPQRN
jgi:cyclomaltodextrinase